MSQPCRGGKIFISDISSNKRGDFFHPTISGHWNIHMESSSGNICIYGKFEWFTPSALFGLLYNSAWRHLATISRLKGWVCNLPWSIFLLQANGFKVLRLKYQVYIDTITIGWSILLMAEILHHLGCMKPYKSWDNLPINWCRISAINSMTQGRKDIINIPDVLFLTTLRNAGMTEWRMEIFFICDPVTRGSPLDGYLFRRYI